MKKFNFASAVERLKDSMGKDEARKKQFGLGDVLESVSEDASDFVALPPWWRDAFGIIGLPFGKMIEISGKPDSGKTSLCLLAMKCAQDQGHGIIYVETENKTTEADFRAAGVDPAGILTISTNLTEQVFSNVSRAIDVVFDEYPELKLLVVIDSFGNTTSMRDSELDLTEKTALVGGAAKVNRLGLGALRAKQNQNPIAILVVNYEYANLGFGHGATNAGGSALEFFCSLIIRASRKGWIEKTQKGVKVRAGAEVVWRTTKNHFVKSLKDGDGKPLLLPKEKVLQITAEGISAK